jgi:hypothetical protein
VRRRSPSISAGYESINLQAFHDIMKKQADTWIPVIKRSAIKLE